MLGGGIRGGWALTLEEILGTKDQVPLGNQVNMTAPLTPYPPSVVTAAESGTRANSGLWFFWHTSKHQRKILPFLERENWQRSLTWGPTRLLLTKQFWQMSEWSHATNSNQEGAPTSHFQLHGPPLQRLSQLPAIQPMSLLQCPIRHYFSWDYLQIFLRFYKNGFQ